jgi:hypothetical protein
MGIPPYFILDKLEDTTHPYQYVVYLGWRGDNDGYAVADSWLKHFEETLGCKGLDFGGPWFYSTYTKKLYFKESELAFFMMKFGDMFGKRPWEVK